MYKENLGDYWLCVCVCFKWVKPTLSLVLTQHFITVYAQSHLLVWGQHQRGFASVLIKIILVVFFTLFALYLATVPCLQSQFHHQDLRLTWNSTCPVTSTSLQIPDFACLLIMLTCNSLISVYNHSFQAISLFIFFVVFAYISLSTSFPECIHEQKLQRDSIFLRIF